ncbi:zinc dependent phospholipase C family protein [Reichenbachiella agarivorans]|uniref:Zinc dependent phospholipase C family protein n=1 Tax=Reichenbachiella agarivorans TaxID=2979464 RepID=A0ABY6CR24_9BACT|nr:zinc dependent phospholipase C family protein [Reichenbachiella agarivorans]UXP31913.1 zinc dependent phospholipase C family protein [Reichenbachiella agarivorans]
MKTIRILAIAIFVLIVGEVVSKSSVIWGFHAHRKINRLAVFTLPPDLIDLYKRHIVYITENAVNPDERRYAIKEEAPRHYIDLDVYGEHVFEILPHRWDSAVAIYTEDTLQAYGIVPWHISLMKWQLTKAFEEHNLEKILRYSADIGHYIADANVPLHTTQNYNGQLTDQHGIHGFWESRLPELWDGDYNFFVGRAVYVDQVSEYVWAGVKQAHLAVDSVLLFEKQLSESFSSSKKYSYEERGNTTVRVYSKKYSQAYHQSLNGMVERQMRASIKMVGDIWYTCWVDAGQPDVSDLLHLDLNDQQKKELKQEKESWKNRNIKSREHN